MKFKLRPMITAALGLLLFFANAFCADDEQVPSCEYIELRVQPELGEIVITSNWMKGTVGVNRLTKRADELEKGGIIPCTGYGPRAIYRKTKMGGKTVETLIVTQPPVDSVEDPDATWTTRVIVVIDGVRKIDCGLGSISGDDISIYGIQLFPEDDCLMMTASDADGHDLVLPEGVDKLDEETVIGNGTLISPDDEDPDADGDQPVPVSA